MSTKKSLSLALITVSVGLFLLSIVTPLVPVAKAVTIPVDNPNTNFSWQDSNTIYDSATKKSYTDYKDDKEHTYVSVSGSKICKASKASTYGNGANMTKPSFGDKPNNVDYFIDFENFDDKSKAALYKVEVDTASTNSTADPICIATKQYDIAIASTSTQSNPFEYTSATNITGKDFIDLNMTILAQDDARLAKINQNGKYVYVDDTASDCQSYLVLGESGGKVTPDSGTLYRFYTDPSTDKCMEGGIKYINGGGPGLTNTQEYPKTSTVSINNSNLFNEKTAKNPGDKAAPAAGTVDNTTPESTGTEEGDGCDNALSPWGWVMCPIITMADSFYTWFFNDVIQSNLHIPKSAYDNNGLKQAWGNFVKIANTVIVLIALVMIVSQIFSLEVFSAYTVKKVLPRLVIGAIAIQLSWFLATTAIEVMNAIGDGIYWLIMQPFWADLSSNNNTENGMVPLEAILDHVGNNTLSSNLANGVGSIGAIGLAIAAGGAIFATGAFMSLVVLAIGAVISLLVAVFTIMLRQGILAILLALTPLAIALWILPGTNRFWKMWADNFLKLLLMYPLIMLLIASGTIGAFIMVNNSGTVIKMLLGVIIYFAPLFLIGATFKMAGSTMSFIGGSIQKLGKKTSGSSLFGLRDRAKENREYSAWNRGKKMRAVERQRKAIEKAGTYMTTEGGGLGRRLNRRVATYGLDKNAATRAQASAYGELSKIKDEDKNAQIALLNNQISSGMMNRGKAAEFLAETAIKYKDDARGRAAMEIITQRQMTEALDSITGDKNPGFGGSRQVLQGYEATNPNVESFLWNNRRDLSAKYNIPATASTGTTQDFSDMKVGDLLPQKDGFWTKARSSGAQFNDTVLDAVYEHDDFALLGGDAKAIIEKSRRLRGLSYNSSGGTVASRHGAGSNPPTTPPTTGQGGGNPPVPPPGTGLPGGGNPPTTPQSPGSPTGGSNPPTTPPVTGQGGANP